MAATNPYTINHVTVESLVSKLEAKGGEDKASFQDLKELLNHVQKYRLRRPQVVTRYGPVLLRKFEAKLGQSRAAVLREQILLAALDMHDRGLMQEMDEELAAAFPGGSNRRLRLHAMREEVLHFHNPPGRATAARATDIYDGMVKENISNVLAHKRLIALTRDRGQEAKSIEMLVKFLSTFQNDTSGWLELAELYVSRNALSEAKFCYEEVMTMNPRNPAHPFHVCRYAEVLYSLASAEKNINTDLVEQARCYFALSLQMQMKGNLRALYGLLTASKYVVEDTKATNYHVEARASLLHAQTEIKNYYSASTSSDAATQACVDHALAAYSEQ